MINHDYPVQRTNPARDLYRYWHQIVEYNAPHLLIPWVEGENAGRYHAWDQSVAKISGYELHVDRKDVLNGKPMLYIPGVFRIWPDGQFSVLLSCRRFRWCRSYLDTLEKITFLRWGYPSKEKAMWVQDTPRRGTAYGYRNTGAVNREYPDPKDFERRTPYLPLDAEPLFHHDVKYRLKEAANNKWIIAASGPRNLHSIVKQAQKNLDLRYEQAERRYDRWQRRHELAAIRSGAAAKPPRAMAPVDRLDLLTTIKQNLTVYEPKVGPGGQPLAQQLTLPMNGTFLPTNGKEEVVNVGS